MLVRPTEARIALAQSENVPTLQSVAGSTCVIVDVTPVSFPVRRNMEVMHDNKGTRIELASIFRDLRQMV